MAGNVLRELVTLFGFEVDEKGAREVDKRVDKMKQGIGGLGKLLGVTVAGAGAKAFFNIGQSAERAQFELQRLAGTDFKTFRRQFRDIQQEINQIREGAAEVVTEQQFDVAAAGFLKLFGRGQEQFQAFRRLFSFAAKQAAITGQNVTSIFEQIQSGIQGGGFEQLLDLPGFDVFRKQLLEFQQQAIDPGDPGGRIALQNRLRALLAITTEAAGDQADALRQVPKELLEVDKTSAGANETLQKLGKTLNNLLIPAFKGVNVVLKRFNDLVDVGRQQETAGGAARAILNELISPAAKPEVVTPISGTAPSVFPGAGGNVKREGDTITMNNTFNIPGAGSPEEITRKIAEGLRTELLNAKRSIVKTEE